MFFLKRLNNILLTKHKKSIVILILLIFIGSLVELLGFGILSEILSEEPFIMFEESYGFRCENSFTTVRSYGWEAKSERSDMGLPHVVRPPQQANAMRYQVAGKKIFSGLTRVSNLSMILIPS